MRRWLAAVALLPGLCGAQHYLVASGELIDVTGPASGHAQALAWLHMTPDQRVFVAGASRFKLDQTRWTLGRLEYSQPASSRLRLSGAFEAGPAESNGERFTYRKLRAGLDYAIGAGLTMALSDTWLNIRPSAGHVLGADLSWRASARLHLKLGIHEALGSHLDASALAARLDYYGRVHFYAGAVDGRTSDTRLLNLTGGLAASGDYRQGYAGINLPLGATTLSLTFDLIDAGAATRRALSVGLKLPLARRSRQR